MLESAENLHNELITWVPLEGGGGGPFPMYSLVTLDTYYLCVGLNVRVLPMGLTVSILPMGLNVCLCVYLPVFSAKSII